VVSAIDSVDRHDKDQGERGDSRVFILQCATYSAFSRKGFSTPARSGRLNRAAREYLFAEIYPLEPPNRVILHPAEINLFWLEFNIWVAEQVVYSQPKKVIIFFILDTELKAQC
jgi:hypothetical protein